MQISIVMLLFSDQISGRGKSFQGGQTASGGAPLPPVEESQQKYIALKLHLNGTKTDNFNAITNCGGNHEQFFQNRI